MNILFTICGRAGSKGVRNKNIREFCGYPLVFFSIAAIFLYSQKYTDDSIDVVLNTDSEELIDIVSGQSVVKIGIIRRKSELAEDDVPKVLVIRDCYEKSKLITYKSYDLVVDLDLTSPLRTIEDIRAAIVRKLENPASDVVYSVTHARRNPYFNMVKEQNGFFVKAMPSSYTTRQQAPVFYDMNASIYVYSPNALINKASSTFFNENTDTIITFDTAILDIDSEDDYELMQVIARHLYKTKNEYCEVYDAVSRITAKQYIRE
jgi:CMP-N,N'-diacetyllegionaminic acid synthase